jgi:hypothetical protein
MGRLLFNETSVLYYTLQTKMKSISVLLAAFPCFSYTVGKKGYLPEKRRYMACRR